jgi:very-short-patch-repair endonuclease
MKGINRYKTTEWFRICPKCNNKVYHKDKNSLRTGLYFNRQCWECKQKQQSQMLIGKKRKPFSNKWRRNLSIGHKKSEIWRKSMNTPEYKEKHRQKMYRLIKEGRYGRVGFNLNACKVFDYINKKLNWNGLHAKNQGEKTVNNFILDFYEPTFNVVIEWDEKYHKKSKRKQKDWFRQKIIIENINCEFYRIDDTTKIIKKTDKTSIDRTQQLQQIINEYYENQK